MTIGNITDQLNIILDDPSEAEQYLTDNPYSQFARRTYIRSIFSGIEGVIWTLKNVYLNMRPVKGKRVITIAEYCVLKEETYDLKNNGEIKSTPKFIRLEDNLKFTLNIYNRILKTDIDLGVNTPAWNAFTTSIKIRNRITHPKNSADLAISDEEINSVKLASGWFNDLCHAVISGIIDTSTKIHESLMNDDENKS